MRNIAGGGGCFFLSCNQFARRSDYPTPYVTRFGDAPETILPRGGTCIVNPLGDRCSPGPHSRLQEFCRRPWTWETSHVATPIFLSGDTVRGLTYAVSTVRRNL